MASGTGTSSASPRSGLVTLAPRRARVLTRLASAGIGSSILIMVAASMVRSSRMYPPMAVPAWGPPWDLQSVRVSTEVVTGGLWLAAILGGAGVTAGLLAVRNGARPSVRTLLIVATLAVAALTVLPPAGSTDAFDYASYGRIVALGHSPYVTTPSYLRVARNAFAQSVPVVWDRTPSVYGPLATIEQFLAAKLGGASPARILFWLKLWTAGAFVIVTLVIDRLLFVLPALAALSRASRDLRRHHRGGPGAPSPACRCTRPARYPAPSGAQRRVAVLLAVSAALVRRDDHLRAGVLPCVPARLARADPAHHRHDLRHARESWPPC
jgi:hypothetical protein